MQFILIAHDKADGLPIRKEHRPAHLEFLKVQNVAYAGPLLDAVGDPYGSIVVIEAADEDAARAVFEADPYAMAGLFEMTTISGFRNTFRDGKLV